MELSRGQGVFPGDVALGTVREWTLWLTEVERRIGAQFTRREARGHAGAYLRGLLSPVERKNGWQWPKSMARRPRMGSSICWDGRSGTPMPP